MEGAYSAPVMGDDNNILGEDLFGGNKFPSPLKETGYSYTHLCLSGIPVAVWDEPSGAYPLCAERTCW